MSMPNVTGSGVDELMFGSADAFPGCVAGQTLRVSIDVDGRPVLMLGSSRAHISDPATLDRLIAGLTAARARQESGR